VTKGSRFSLDAASETLKLAKPSRFRLPDKTILQSNTPQNVNMTTIDRAQTDIVKAPSSQSVFCCVFLTSTEIQIQWRRFRSRVSTLPTMPRHTTPDYLFHTLRRTPETLKHSWRCSIAGISSIRRASSNVHVLLS
jgi:hypothetical protein